MFICHGCRPALCFPCNCTCFLCSDAATNIHGDQGLQRPPSPDHSSSTVSSPVPHQVQFSSEMIAPQSPPPTRFTAKWGAVMSSRWSGGDQTTRKRRDFLEWFNFITSIRKKTLKRHIHSLMMPVIAEDSLQRERRHCSCVQLAVNMVCHTVTLPQ